MKKPKIKLPPEAQAVVDAFDRESSEYLLSLEKPYAPPQRLYHYTTAAGLLGILESGKVWLTDVKDANDSSELIHGVGLAADELVSATKNSSPEVQKFAELAQQLAPMVRENQHFHVCCLSPDGDDLDQWRRYGEAKGFVVGFDGPLLVSQFLAQTLDRGGTLAFDIDYDDELLRNRAHGLIDLVLPHIHWARKYTDPWAKFGAAIGASMQELSVILFGGLMTIAYTHKHHGFKGERETRLLELTGSRGPGDRMRSRLRGLKFLPYTEYEWARAGQALPLLSIRSGPAVNRADGMEFMQECARRFRNRFHVPDAQVIAFDHSKQPFVVV